MLSHTTFQRANQVAAKPRFNVYDTPEQGLIDEEVKEIVDIIASKHTIPKPYIRTSVNHLLKECAEIISWQETRAEAYTFIYYENNLPDVLTDIAQTIPKYDATCLPQRTVFLNKHAVFKKQFERKSMSSEKIPLAALLASSENNKAILPMCYAYGEKYTGSALENIVKCFMENFKISPENMYIYLGPYEQYDLTLAESAAIETRELRIWLHENQGFIRSNKLKVIAYNSRFIGEKYKDLLAADWNAADIYKQAEQAVIKVFADKTHKLGANLVKGVLHYMTLKSNEVTHHKTQKAIFIEKYINMQYMPEPGFINNGMQHFTHAESGFKMELIYKVKHLINLIITADQDKSVFQLALCTHNLFRNSRKEHSFYIRRGKMFQKPRSMLIDSKKAEQFFKFYNPLYIALVVDMIIALASNVTLNEEQVRNLHGFIDCLPELYCQKWFSTPYKIKKDYLPITINAAVKYFIDKLLGLDPVFSASKETINTIPRKQLTDFIAMVSNPGAATSPQYFALFYLSKTSNMRIEIIDEVDVLEETRSMRLN